VIDPMPQRLWNLTDVTLAGHYTPRLNAVSIAINRGVTAIVGHSGAGKTSFLNVLVGMEKPSRGTVERDESSAAGTSSNFSVPLFWAPQDSGLWPHLSVIQHLEAVFDLKTLGNTVSERDSADHLDNLLDIFDLNHRRTAFPGELSRGEQSRLATVRLLAANPAVLVMDEPLSHVDPIRRPKYWTHIRQHLNQTGASLLFSTHEPDVAVRESEFVLCLQDGRLVFSGRTENLYHRPDSHAAGEFLGAINWFDSTERSLWLADNDNTIGFGLRPERIGLESVTDGTLEILSFRFAGGYAETQLKHLPTATAKTIFHRPPGDIHRVGQRVRIKVLP